MIDPMPQDPRHALIAVFPWHSAEVWSSPIIYRLDVYNGAKERVGIVPGYQPLGAAIDRAGNLRFAFGNDRESKAHAHVWDDDARDWKEIQFPGVTVRAFDG